MKLRARIHRWHSPTVFTLIALCFLLPFGTVFVVGGCGGTNLNSSTKFTGAQLVTRTVAHGGRDPDCGRDISVCVEQAAATAAEVAFGAAIVGLILGLLGIARGPGWCAAVGLFALLVLWMSLSNLQEDSLSTHAGYSLALLLFLWAGLVHLRRAVKRARAPGRPSFPPGSEPPYWPPPPSWGRPRIGPPPYEGKPHA
jgi:hypothetical protein